MLYPSKKEEITHATINAIKSSFTILFSDLISEALDLVQKFKEQESRGKLVFSD